RDARLVYATILPFLDREGRHVAEPFVLKALVFRRSDFTIEELAACLRELWAADLIRVYGDDDNDAILEYVDFARFNKPNAKEAKSAFPGPTDPTAGPCRDQLLLPAPTPHRQPTGDAPVEQRPTTSPADTQHQQGTGNARATPV